MLTRTRLSTLLVRCSAGDRLREQYWNLAPQCKPRVSATLPFLHAEVLSPLSATPVLFVHGHLGSYQQMRSLAAESGRQVLREAGSRDADSRRGIVWYALDFGAEPSALDLSLLVRRGKEKPALRAVGLDSEE